MDEHAHSRGLRSFDTVGPYTNKHQKYYYERSHIRPSDLSLSLPLTLQYPVPSPQFSSSPLPTLLVPPPRPPSTNRLSPNSARVRKSRGSHGFHRDLYSEELTSDKRRPISHLEYSPAHSSSLLRGGGLALIPLVCTNTSSGLSGS